MFRFVGLMERCSPKLGMRCEILRPYPLFGKTSSPVSRTTREKWLGYIDQFIIFPLTLHIRVRNADIVHICDHSNAMYLPWVKGRPHIITCNDLLAIRSARGLVQNHRISISGRILQAWIAHHLQGAHAVACISEQTRQELIETIQPKSELLRVIYMSQQYPYHPMPPDEIMKQEPALGANEIRFFLHVGGNQWYKNRLGALQLFHALIQFPEYRLHHFAMVGQPLTDELRNYIAVRNLNGRVHELVDITNEELEALYSRAEALLFPSLAEGFGWPPIEAQACGCPVVSSDIAP